MVAITPRRDPKGLLRALSAAAVAHALPADVPPSGLVVMRGDDVPPAGKGRQGRIDAVEVRHPVPDDACRQARSAVSIAPAG